MRELEHVQAIYDLAMSHIPTEDVPNVIFVDGMGRWHPRQAGLATAFGVTREIITIGIGKDYQPIRPDCGKIFPLNELGYLKIDNTLPDEDRPPTSGELQAAWHFRASQKAFKQVAREKLVERGDFLGIPLYRGEPLVGAVSTIGWVPYGAYTTDRRYRTACTT